MTPIILPPNQPPNRFYRGGIQISTFRSSKTSADYQPEDWVASTTCCNGHDTLGLTELHNGALLVEEIQKYPEQWLSPEHIRAFGNSTKLLVKLLDAGQRLPIHAHPHRRWAETHLGATCGKAELWFVLEPGTVWIGLREEISLQHLHRLVMEQKTETLLNLMHEVRLERHQAMYVPPGMLHSIGEGMLIAEVQEPSDLSVLCEWHNFAIDGTKDGHLNLGFDVALTAVEITTRTREDVEALVTGPDVQGLVGNSQATKYFRAERYRVESERSFAPGFSVVIIIGGRLQLETGAGSSMAVCKGMTIVIPYADGDFTLTGEGDIFIARPPEPPQAKLSPS